MAKVLMLLLMIYSISLQAQPAKDSIYINPEVPPQFPGGDFELFSYLEDFLILNTPSQELWYLQSRDYYTLVKFIIDKEGNVRDVKLDYRTDNEVNRMDGIDGSIPRNYLLDEIIAAFELMPRWEPAKINGIPVNTLVYVRVELFYDGNQIIARPRHIFPESAILAERKMTKNQKILGLVAAGLLIGIFYFFFFRN